MNTPQNFDQLYPGRFLKAGHFETPRTLTISYIEHQELEGDTGPKIKVIVGFKEDQLALVACKTNGICFREMLGNHVPSWIGKRVTLHASTWNGEPCIRVYGSPELDRDKEVIVQLPRRKPFTLTMRATKESRSAAAPEAGSRIANLLLLIEQAQTKEALEGVRAIANKTPGLGKSDKEQLRTAFQSTDQRIAALENAANKETDGP